MELVYFPFSVLLIEIELTPNLVVGQILAALGLKAEKFRDREVFVIGFDFSYDPFPEFNGEDPIP